MFFPLFTILLVSSALGGSFAYVLNDPSVVIDSPLLKDSSDLQETAVAPQDLAPEPKETPEMAPADEDDMKNQVHPEEVDEQRKEEEDEMAETEEKLEVVREEGEVEGERGEDEEEKKEEQKEEETPKEEEVEAKAEEEEEEEEKKEEQKEEETPKDEEVEGKAEKEEEEEEGKKEEQKEEEKDVTKEEKMEETPKEEENEVKKEEEKEMDKEEKEGKSQTEEGKAKKAQEKGKGNWFTRLTCFFFGYGCTEKGVEGPPHSKGMHGIIAVIQEDDDEEGMANLEKAMGEKMEGELSVGGEQKPEGTEEKAEEEGEAKEGATVVESKLDEQGKPITNVAQLNAEEAPN